MSHLTNINNINPISFCSLYFVIDGLSKELRIFLRRKNFVEKVLANAQKEKKRRIRRLKN